MSVSTAGGFAIVLGKLIAPISSAAPLTQSVPASARAVSRAFFLRAKAAAYAILLAEVPTYNVSMQPRCVQNMFGQLTALIICLIGP
jgi:hypothetical protein